MFIKEDALKKLCYLLWELDLDLDMKNRMINRMNKDFLRIFHANPENHQRSESAEDFENLEDVGLDETAITEEKDDQKTDISYDEVIVYLTRKIDKIPFDFSRLLTDAIFADQHQITRKDRSVILIEEAANLTQITAADEQVIDQANINIEADDESVTKATSKKRGIPRKEEKEILVEAEYFKNKVEKANLNKFFNNNGFNHKQKIEFALDRFVKKLPYEAYRSNTSLKQWALFISDVKDNEKYISEINGPATSFVK